MAKFGIGARVRDDGGDEGVIVDKTKGRRKVKYDYAAYGELWTDKDRLTALDTAPANDNAAAWMPKVGDRVRFTEKYANKNIGDEVVVTSFSPATSIKNGYLVDYVDGCVFSTRIEPVVAPATTEERADAGGGFKVGDRLRLIDGALDTMPLGTEVVAAARTSGLATSAHYTGEDGRTTWRPGSYFELVPPLTIEAGKFYRTRDGRKVGPLEQGEQFSFGGPWLFKTDTHYYQADGFSCRGNNGNNTFAEDDLVAEWVEPVAPAAQLNVGDRVVIANHDKDGEFSRFGSEWKDLPIGSEHTIVGIAKDGENWKLSGSGLHFWTNNQLRPAPNPLPAFPRNTTVALTGTARVSATNENGHIQVVFADLPPGANSFALPPSILIAA